MATRTRRLLLVALGTLALGIAAVAAFVWWGPIPVADKRVMLDFLLGRGIAPPNADTVARRLRVPPGFRVQVYSAEVPLARVMAFSADGDLIVSRTRADLVSILERDRNGDGVADGHRVLLEGLDGPHGLALSCYTRSSFRKFPGARRVAEGDCSPPAPTDPDMRN